MKIVSSKPRVVSSATFAPRRSMKAFVAAVVPWAIRSTSRRNASSSSPASPAASRRFASTPSSRSPGVVGDL